jgi:hypothetical protein
MTVFIIIVFLNEFTGVIKLLSNDPVMRNPLHGFPWIYPGILPLILSWVYLRLVQ